MHSCQYWIAAAWMPPTPRIFRPAFDRSCRVRSVGKLEWIAIDDSVISQPERWCRCGDQDELHGCCPREAERGLGHSHIVRAQSKKYDCRRHGHRQKPSVVASQASRRQTQTALRKSLRVSAHQFAEIYDRPDKKREIHRLAHGGSLQ